MNPLLFAHPFRVTNRPYVNYDIISAIWGDNRKVL